MTKSSNVVKVAITALGRNKLRSLLTTLGIGLSFTPIAMAATSGVAPQDAGLASGLVNTMRQVGGSLGLAIFATLMTRYPVQIKAAIGAHITAGRPEVTQRIGVGPVVGVAQGCQPQFP